jgi:hypothetical protein
VLKLAGRCKKIGENLIGIFTTRRKILENEVHIGKNEQYFERHKI